MAMLQELLVFLVVITDARYGSVQGSKSKVSLHNNRYSGIVIAINPNVTEDPSLIEAIKQAWSDASPVLFAATRSRAYFGDITILIPSTWVSTPYDSISTGETYNKADVLVANPNPSYDEIPYTVQYGGCGSPGSYIHLTPNYLTEDWISANFGGRAKVIVHEWAHYRWGVFDESSVSDPFYDDPTGNTLSSYYGEQPLSYTQCAKDIKVCCMEPPYSQTCLPGSSYCTIDPATGLYSDSCICYVSNYIDGYDASIMSHQYSVEITQFCDDTQSNTSRVKHNKNAPNDQNRLCEMRSTWSVISQSTDFANGANPENPSISVVSPTFLVKKSEVNKRFVLVLDVSGSMGSTESSGETRLEIANKAARYFISSVPIGSYVGVVIFSSTASTNINLYQIRTDGDRDFLTTKLPTSSGGGTCIGCGIDEGIEVLEKRGSAAGGYLIVMTDGLGSLDTSTAENVLAKSVTVETLIIYTSANEALVNLSEASGGSCFFAESDDFLAMVGAYAKISNAQDGDSTKINFEIESETVTLNSSSLSHTSIINIDPTVGNSTIFTYTWSYDSKPPNVQLQPPSGSCNVISAPGTSSCADISSDTAFKTLTIKIRGTAPAGAWKSVVSLSSSSAQTISIIVNSKAARSDVEPIMVESALEMSDGIPLVYAKVTQGLNPVLLANVTVTLSSQGGDDISPTELFDAGADPDIRKHDGIYSRYITGIAGGRYSIKVRVESQSGGFDSDAMTFGYSRAAYNPGYVYPNGTVAPNPNGPTFLPNESTFGITAEQLGNFTRQIAAGAFDYTAPGSSTDNMPPSKVLDLSVKQNNFTDFTKGIVLSFTAPGDDYDSGTASRYEFRYTLGNPQNLVDDFAANNLVSQTDIIHGDISNPSIAGSKEAFVIITPSAVIGAAASISIGFALKSYDEANNEARISNVANLRYFIEPPSFAAPAAITTEVVPITSHFTSSPTTRVSTRISSYTSAPTTTVQTITSGSGVVVQTETTRYTATPTDIPTTTTNTLSGVTTGQNQTSYYNTSKPSIVITTSTKECKDCQDKTNDLLWLYITLPVLALGGGIGILVWLHVSKRWSVMSNKSTGSVSPEPLEMEAVGSEHRTNDQGGNDQYMA